MAKYLFYDKTAADWLHTAEKASRGDGDERTEFIRRLIGCCEECGFSGDPWQHVLTRALILDENPYSLAAERHKALKGSLGELVLSDIQGIYESFHHAPVDIGTYTCSGTDKKYSAPQKERMESLCDELARSESPQAFLAALLSYYGSFGCGQFGIFGAFALRGVEGLAPVSGLKPFSLDELIGYETQKAELVANTEAFLAGRRANNCLLYGEAGTGKSSSIRGLLFRYFDRGLRIVEVYKHQYKHIHELLKSLSKRNYRYILYLDDLSFEEFEVEYKYLKAVIEGGLSGRPENVLIYATSNRRHLVRERFDDRPESPLDKHQNETVQEKLSLFARFGLAIYYGAPEHKEYLHIVHELAKRQGLDTPEDELNILAGRWEISHGGLSGRTAVQLVDHLSGREGQDG